MPRLGASEHRSPVVSVTNVLLAAIVTLLMLCAFQLSRLADKPAGQSAERGAITRLPPFPQPRTGGSTQALVTGLERSGRRLSGQVQDAVVDVNGRLAGSLKGVSGQLNALRGLARSAGGITAFATPLNHAVDMFEAITRDLETLTRVAHEVRRPALTALKRIGAFDVDRLTTRLDSFISKMDAHLTGIQGEFAELNAKLADMAGNLQRIRQCTERPIVCR
jgi:hypothetical protein